MTGELLPGFTGSMIEQYSRQIVLDRLGGHGMQRLRAATVGIVGAGGLGCPAIQVLAAAGVGHLKIADGDVVEISNLPRQWLHHAADVGRKKVDSVRDKVRLMNPGVSVTVHDGFVSPDTIEAFLHGCDFAIEATDTFATKFLVNDACVRLGIPFAIAGAVQYFGQVLSVLPHVTACYRCIFDGKHAGDESMTCSGAGVLGTVPALAGILQANEAIKHLTGMPSGLRGSLLVFDLLGDTFDSIKVSRRARCPACGEAGDDT